MSEDFSLKESKFVKFLVKFYWIRGKIFIFRLIDPVYEHNDFITLCRWLTLHNLINYTSFNILSFKIRTCHKYLFSFPQLLFITYAISNVCTKVYNYFTMHTLPYARPIVLMVPMHEWFMYVLETLLKPSSKLDTQMH